MGRPWKFAVGDTAWLVEDEWGIAEVTVAVVDRRHKRYRVVRLTTTGEPVGDATWVRSWNLVRKQAKSKVAPRNYKANAKLPDRGCECQCCVHVRIPPSEAGRWDESV